MGGGNAYSVQWWHIMVAVPVFGLPVIHIPVLPIRRGRT